MMEFDRHRIEIWGIDRLKPYANNVKKHPEEQIRKLMNSIRSYGYVQPIVVLPDGEIVIGHGRFEALRRLGFKKVPVIVADLTKEQAKALRIADNRLAELAVWDEGALRVELEELLDSGHLEELEVGFDEKEIDKLLEWVEDYEEKRKPERGTGGSFKTITEIGDIWLLDEHKVICGDSTDEGVYAKLLGEEKVVMVFTSPPYALQRKNEYGGISPEDYPKWFSKVMESVGAYLAEGGSVFVNIKEHTEKGERQLYFYETLFLLKAHGWKYIDRFVWLNPAVRGNFTNRLPDEFEDVHWIAKSPQLSFVVNFLDENVLRELENRVIEGELILDHFSEIFHLAKQVAVRFYPRQVGRIGESFTGIRGLRKNKTSTGNVNVSGTFYIKRVGVVLPTNVIKTGGSNENWGHPASFPKDLPAFFISLTTKKGDVVLDPFNGSGSTLIACAELGRIYRGIEIQPSYVDATVHRYVAWKKSSEGVYLLRNGERVPYSEIFGTR